MRIGDDRAQSIQLGAILLFGFLIISMTIYQATIVPQQNAKVEFNAYQEASADMTALRSDMLASSGRSVQTSTTVKTGAQYPARVIFVNPGPPDSRVRTTDRQTISIRNATATSDEVNDYWNGSKNFTTRHVEFSPGYNEIDVSPVVASGQLTYRNASQRAILLDSQTVISGNRINLVTVAGNVSAGGYSSAITSEPVSASTRTITVSNTTGDEMVVVIPTRLSNETWERILQGEMTAQGGHVMSVTQQDSNHVAIHLENGTYELRLSRIVLRESGDETQAGSTSAHYVVSAAGDGQSITADQTATLTAEARDRFNNPKAGTNLTFVTKNGSFARGGSIVNLITDEDGRATVRFKPASAGTKTVRAGFDTDRDGNLTDESARNVTNFTVNVLSGASLGGSSDPATAGGDASGVIVLQDAYPSNGTGGTGPYRNVTFKLNNTAASDINATGIRLGYVTEWESQSGSGPGTGGVQITDGPNNITGVTVRNASGVSESESVLAVEGQAPAFFNQSHTLTAGETNTFEIRLDEDYHVDGSQATAISVTIYFEGGFAAQYSVYLFDHP